MRKLRKIMSAIFVVVFIMGNISGSLIQVHADTVGIVFSETVDDVYGSPGDTVHVKLPIRATGEYLLEPRVTVVTEGMPFSVKNIALTGEGYTQNNPPVSIPTYQTIYIEFDLAVKETAKIGISKLQVNVDASYYDNDGGKVQNTYAVPPVNFVISEEKEPAQLTVDNVNYDDAIIGQDMTLEFTIRNEGEITARNAYFSIDDASFKDAGISPNYSKLEQKIGSEGILKAGDTYQAKLPLSILKDATAGTKDLTITMTYKDLDGESYTDTSMIYITIDSNNFAPDIEVVSTKYASELVAGDSFNLVTTIQNTGETKAKNIKVTVDGLSTEGFLPGYTKKTISVSDLSVKGKTDVKIPLIVSNEATVGLKELTITFTYEDNAGVEIKTTTTAYLEVETAEGVDVNGKPNIVITNVTQNPLKPNAGARVDISFDIENKSKLDINDVKISLANTTAGKFTPLSSEPYYYIDSLKGGKKARVTIPLMATDTIPDGTNSIDLQYEFTDANGKNWTKEENSVTTLYILDVQNSGVGASKPKLIISNFTTDVEELRAGSTFNFTFDIKNTHPSVDARNIKVTVTQADNIFSVANGSNTFYVTNIPAGETVQNTLELKVKSDAVTKTYPIVITMDYEYEGAEANPTTGEIGETVEETINLQAVENSRPVVDNIVVGSWESPVVNQPTVLSFQFYNMGKSILNNVQASVEGDYTLSTGNMYFIGNVEAGSQEYAELEVIPNVEGQAKGTLLVTFEDSNGDEITITKEFEGTIMSEYVPDMGEGSIPDMGVIPQAKAAILPTWTFVIIQLVIFAIAVPVSRKIKLQLHRKKLMKEEDNE